MDLPAVSRAAARVVSPATRARFSSKDICRDGKGIDHPLQSKVSESLAVKAGGNASASDFVILAKIAVPGAVNRQWIRREKLELLGRVLINGMKQRAL